MGRSEYQNLLALKAAAAAEHDARKFARRQRIADEILRNPEKARRLAAQSLKNKTEPGQQWSRMAWLELLQTKPLSDLVELIMHPRGDEEALADSHPFGLLATTSWWGLLDLA